MVVGIGGHRAPNRRTRLAIATEGVGWRSPLPNWDIEVGRLVADSPARALHLRSSGGCRRRECGPGATSVVRSFAL